MLPRDLMERHVREALARLDDRPYLEAHPLVDLLVPSRPGAPADALRRLLLEAIDQLRPPEGTPANAATWRRWRCLRLHHVEGAPMKQIGRQLGVTERQARRDHAAGVDAIAAVLWRRTEARSRPHIGDDASYLVDLTVEAARVADGTPGGTADVAHTVDDALATVRGLAEARHSRFDISRAPDLSPVTIDASILRQALLCLLAAALREEFGPNIRVAIQPRPDEAVEVRIRVEPARHAPFSPEVEALVTAARRLIQPQGASVVADDSDVPLFALVLPTRRASVVLVVDDNPYVADLFGRFLAGEPYRLVQARAAQRALELAHSLGPDVIVLDVMMPSQDGWQVLQQLRESANTREIPVIVCSVLPERELALSLGANAFLAKPVTLLSLREALDRSLAPDPEARAGGRPGTSPLVPP